MANDKYRKMKLKSKARPQAAGAWDGPQPKEKRPGKRAGNGRRSRDSE